MSDNMHNDALVAEATVEMTEPQLGETHVSIEKPTSISWTEFPDAASMRAHIFSTPDIKEEMVEVPEWGVKILVRGMNGKTRSRLLQGAMKKDGSPDLEKMYPDFVIATARDPLHKDLLFTPADREALNEKSGGILERLAMTAARLSGLDQATQEATASNFRP